MPDIHDTTILGPDPRTLTHFVFYDTPGASGRTARAACGLLVDPRRDHRNDPSCPTCRQRVEDYNNLSF